MFLADLLSRPAGTPTSKEEKRAMKVELHVGSVLLAREMSDDKMIEEIRIIAGEEILYSEVVREVDSGWR